MASDETMTNVSSMQEDEYDETDDGYGLDHDHQLHGVSLSRQSICTNEDDDDFGPDDRMKIYMSRLSMESFDADVEFFDEKEGKEPLEMGLELSELAACYSLPATPPGWRSRSGVLLSWELMGVDKDYTSETETLRQKVSKNLRKRRMRKENLVDKNRTESGGEKREGDFSVGCRNYSGSFSGESEGGGGGGGVVVITRPKGGRRSLCMDLEEVKACRDLGFELEHERMLEIPSLAVSLSGSTLDTSSGGDSPIADWRISSPGDDPRDVKARLKVWAQAVALASASGIAAE
ncbi:hypothetical protein SLE2022_241090 [Rubroshorea leprosula]